jgi:hypothetical protein
MNCPICGRKVNHTTYSSYDIGIEEENEECSNCNYYYEYAYGRYTVTFGKYHFGWTYRTSGNHKFFKKLNKQLKNSAHTYRQGHIQQFKHPEDFYTIYIYPENIKGEIWKVSR